MNIHTGDRIKAISDIYRIVMNGDRGIVVGVEGEFYSIRWDHIPAATLYAHISELRRIPLLEQLAEIDVAQP